MVSTWVTLQNRPIVLRVLVRVGVEVDKEHAYSDR